MKVTVQQPKTVARTMDSNPRAAKQTPVSVILQRYATQLQGVNDNKGLERAANRAAQSSVIQKMAWIMTRPLGQQEGDYGKDRGLGVGNLRLNHRHIVFSEQQLLPIGGQHARFINTDNIGFHCANGGLMGPGELFTEAGIFGYRVERQVSNNNNDDAALVGAIHQNANPGNYNILTHNCQDWVDAVMRNYGHNVRPQGLMG